MFVVAHNGARIWGGAERATALLLAGLQGRGHRVLLLCNAELVARHAEELGVPTRICRLGGAGMFPHAVRLAAVLRRLRPDAFIVGTFRKLFLAALGARLAGVPRVVQRIGLETDRPARGLRYRWALGHLVDAVVVNAEAMRAAFLAAAPRRDPARVLTLYHGPRVAPPSRAADEVRRELGIPPGAMV
ncbi:MAG TPA: glycosyltransferase, partial [Longimicrobium sp.]|nr:glycosyltransferase [Longimicrobium sp.]